MKKVKLHFLIILCILAGISIQAQEKKVKEINETIDYFLNGIDSDLLEFDDSGIWQIGEPDKEDWDSAYDGRSVIITETNKMLNTPCKASFYFKWERPLGSNCVLAWKISLHHKYQFPLHRAGGYIEISYNKGINWFNIANDTLYNTDHIDYYKDTLLNGQIAFSGIRNEWGDEIQHTIAGNQFYPDSIAAKIHSLWLRFTYENLDTISHKGWMIDNMKIRITHFCEFLSIDEINSNEVVLFPNPLSESSVIEFDNSKNEEYVFEICDISGRILQTRYVCENSIPIRKSDFVNGYYFYRLYNKAGIEYKGRFIVK